jgi:hypothetical protein
VVAPANAGVKTVFRYYDNRPYRRCRDRGEDLMLTVVAAIAI